ncbi:MAG TPA: TetR/AcrR family transcriptional regulator [Stellaceae bacterium]|nr:TetR/AcrR family transcriptional regulator [Stellaceae bacterium]
MSIEPLRRTGRPDQQASEELVRHIIDTATRLFIAHGYPATSIEQIAAAAGSGKQTIYRRFASKENLFIAVISRQTQRLAEQAEAAGAPCADPVEALRESCRRLFDFALMPDMIRLHRILVAEVSRFPDVGEYVLTNCMAPFRDLLNRQLLAAMDAGRIRRADPALVQAMLRGLVTGWPVQQYLLGSEPFASERERDTFFAAAWALFLGGVR